MAKNITQPLTPTEQTNLTAWTRANRPEFAPRERIRVVTFPIEPTYTAWDYETARQHAQEMSTMGIGPSLEEQRRARQRAHREAMAFTIIGAAATVGGLILLWALSMVVRGLVG